MIEGITVGYDVFEPRALEETFKTGAREMFLDRVDSGNVEQAPHGWLWEREHTVLSG